MTDPVALTLDPIDLDRIAGLPGTVAVVLGPEGKMGRGAARVNKLTKGALKRFAESEAFAKMKPGDSLALSWPAGLEASAVLVLRLDRKSDLAAVRRAGAALGAALPKEGATAIAEGVPHLAEFCLAARLRAYRFTEHKTDKGTPPGPLAVMVADPQAAALAAADGDALASGVFFTRDLVSEPANVLTTTEFAARLEGLSELGVKVEVLDEEKLTELGMNALLGVGQGSRSPSKVVVMEWSGGAGDTPPLAFVGKGVVFDTGGISIKPAGGMEEMTMDMGGAGVVAGVMKAVALRKARANVVGVVGLVENMPDGNAQRPGDIVRSMKGDTIEVVNTDAEGRLVLADILWYTADRFKPRGMVNLATLTGAIIIALGHENAGVFSNDDAFAGAFLKAAEATGEGAWRMPLGAAYDKLINTPLADMKNTGGGRAAGSITAAQFLARFVKEGTPWIHLDIAGVALVKAGTTMAPKGATGWGVRALDRLVRDLGEH